MKEIGIPHSNMNRVVTDCIWAACQSIMNRPPMEWYVLKRQNENKMEQGNALNLQAMPGRLDHHRVKEGRMLLKANG